MNRKAVLIIVSSGIIIILAIILTSVIEPWKGEVKDPLKDITGEKSAKMQHHDAPEGEHVIIPDDMLVSLQSTLAGLTVVPSNDTVFDEAWIYIITFNWNRTIRNQKVTTVFVGEKSMLVDDTVYFVPEDANFIDVLDYLAFIYNYAKNK